MLDFSNERRQLASMHENLMHQIKRAGFAPGALVHDHAHEYIITRVAANYGRWVHPDELPEPEVLVYGNRVLVRGGIGTHVHFIGCAANVADYCRAAIGPLPEGK